MSKGSGKHLEDWASPRTVIVLTLLFIALLWSAVAFWVVSAREERIATTGEALQRMTHAVADQTRRQFRLVNVFLATSAQWLEANPGRDARTDPAFRKLIAGFRSAAGVTIGIRLLAADGSVVDVLDETPPPPPSVADRDYFSDATNDGTLFIGRPARVQPGQGFVLPVALRLTAPTHGLTMLLAEIDAAKLSEVYDMQRRKPGGSITLLRRDGMVLARAPDDLQLLGQPLPGGVLAGELLAPQLSNVVLLEEAEGSQQRQLVSYSPVPDWPLVVMVAADYEQLLAPWLKQTLWVVLLALGITLPLAVVAYRSLRLLQVLANRDAELQHLATTDRLTGVSSRHHFVESLENELLRAHRSQSPLTILLFDIDFFKRINDGYGHAIGDRALIAFAEVARDCLRGMDLLGRLGAGEFAILLRNTDVSDAVVVAERVREGIARISIPTENGTVQFTASVGASQANASDQSFDDVLKRAAKALYDAKAGGHDHLAVI
ncbi:sensor domain-containing diguanylate cyclase [Accumulibacter sp.]|uniref:sensor domain-containing diguanylate cyclase n=1 Tax=Accumulibacter sp. TaxID=2053492 RepID=UPI0026240BC6|nr:sensor domain-containing diguanylate cyclase [Accumulibacter sp.]